MRHLKIRGQRDIEVLQNLQVWRGASSRTHQRIRDPDSTASRYKQNESKETEDNGDQTPVNK
jgi:hypothetical protein